MNIYLEETFPEYSFKTSMGYNFYIVDTSFLNNIVDNIRITKGKTPLFRQDMECDLDGWYEMRINVDKEGNPIDIEAWLEGSDQDDAAVYYINAEDVDGFNDVRYFDFDGNEVTKEELIEMLNEEADY